MYKLQISDEMKKLHKKYFEKNICKRLNERWNSNQNDKFYSDFLSNVLDKWATLAVGTVSELKNVDEEIRKSYNQLSVQQKQEVYDDFGYEKFKIRDLYDYYKDRARKNGACNRDVVDNVIELLKKDFPEYESEIISKIEQPLSDITGKADFARQEIKTVITEEITLHNFKNYVNLFNNEWNPYYLLFLSGVRICPYCNRQYVVPVLSHKGRVRAELDHYMSKKKYPYFSMSLYNLIPSCSVCNSSLKGSKQFSFADLHPYRDEIANSFEFRIYSQDEGTVEIKAKDPNEEQRVQNYADMFMLETLYNYHTDIVKDLIAIRKQYSEKQIKDMYKKTAGIFGSEKELRSRLVGGIPQDSNKELAIMGKLKLDILKQLKLI